LYGGVDRIYLRRTFALGTADPQTTAMMGQELNSMLRTGRSGFVEIRPTRPSDFSFPTAANPNAPDQAAMLAEQIPGARVVRVTGEQIQQFARTGAMPEGLTTIQQEMIRDAARDVVGLGSGAFPGVVRIYKP
jgi:hypothetical protein